MAKRNLDKHLQESGRLFEAEDDGTRPIRIISSGWGSSGYYSPEVLQEAADSKTIPAGTFMYLNHQSKSERVDQPERKIQDIAAVLTEDAVVTDLGSGDYALDSRCKPMGPHAELLESLAPYIGLSISGDATDITWGTAGGKEGRIVEGLAHVDSVDFVTRAGRGGMVLLESARPSVANRTAIEHGLSESTANDMREQLSDLVRDAHGGDKIYVWVCDFDPDAGVVYFEIESEDVNGVFAQSYTGTDTLELTGEREERRKVTNYVPVTESGDNQEEEGDMPQIEEAELTRLRESDRQVTELRESLTTATRERDEERARNIQLVEAQQLRTRQDRAREIIEERAKDQKVAFTPLEVRGLLATLPVTESGALDEAAFTSTVNKDIEEALRDAEQRGYGHVRGMGPRAVPAQQQDAQLQESYDAKSGSVFGRPVKEA